MKLVSYNPSGCNDINLNYMSELSKTCDILAIQEYWKLSSQLHKITDSIKDFTGTAISGVEESVCALRGCPYGGCALLWKLSLYHLFTRLDHNSVSRRVCGALLTLSTCVYLMLCVYVPTKPGACGS